MNYEDFAAQITYVDSLKQLPIWAHVLIFAVVHAVVYLFVYFTMRLAYSFVPDTSSLEVHASRKRLFSVLHKLTSVVLSILAVTAMMRSFAAYKIWESQWVVTRAGTGVFEVVDHTRHEGKRSSTNNITLMSVNEPSRGLIVVALSCVDMRKDQLGGRKIHLSYTISTHAMSNESYLSIKNSELAELTC